MSNPNNLVRPPVLNAPNHIPIPIPNPAVQLNEELETRIAAICAQQCRNIVQSLINPNDDLNHMTDQNIEDRYRNDLSELDKIPDIVRSLRDFSGNPMEFNSWKKSVDRVLQIYDSSKGTPKYYGILNVIRNKITGTADIALESYNTPLNWNCIVKCLSMHYADKRDLGTLEYQMTSLIQGRNTIQTFYQEVYTHLSLILNKIGCMEMGQESLRLLTQTYRDKALDTFVRGLNGDLPRLLGIREPADLPQALHLCLKLENQNYRTEYANKHQNHRQRQSPPLPIRNANTIHRQPFYPELTFQKFNQCSRPMNNMQQNAFQNRQTIPNINLQQNFQPQRPTAPKPQRPQPMEIDESIQTRNINYQNRPRPFNQPQFNNKRPPSLSYVPPPHKQQRNFHIESRQYPSNVPNYQDEQAGNYNENEYEQLIQNQGIDEYAKSYDQDQQDEISTQNFTDIHFLG